MRNVRRETTMIAMEPPIEHRDVTTIMALLGNIDENVAAIRSLLEDDDGEEASKDDP